MELNFSLLNGSDDSVDFKKNVKVKALLPSGGLTPLGLERGRNRKVLHSRVLQRGQASDIPAQEGLRDSKDLGKAVSDTHGATGCHLPRSVHEGKRS